MGASTSGELHRCRAGAAGGAGDEHTVAGPDARSLDHVLGGGVGARDRTEFGVGPVTLDGEDFARRNLHILGEGAVEVRRHPDVVHGVVTFGRMHARTITRFPRRAGSTPGPSSSTMPQQSVPWISGHGVASFQPPSSREPCRR